MVNDRPTKRTGEDQRRSVGDEAERRVAHHLAHLGWRILDRNWRIGLGELDIVGLDRRTIVFVEVKALRSPHGSGPERPVLAVGPNKRDRLSRLASAWLAGPGRGLGANWEEVRFDVVGVEFGRSAVSLEHLEDAFRPHVARPAGSAWLRRRGWR